MPMFLKAEHETEISGDGGGFISIVQKNHVGEESIVWLSIHQFEMICDDSKQIVREALGQE